MYAIIIGDNLYIKEYSGDVYDYIMEEEETLGLIELALTDEYIIYKTDCSCLIETLVLVGNNPERSLSLKAQYQLTIDF